MFRFAREKKHAPGRLERIMPRCRAEKNENGGKGRVRGATARPFEIDRTNRTTDSIYNRASAGVNSRLYALQRDAPVSRHSPESARKTRRIALRTARSLRKREPRSVPIRRLRPSRVSPSQNLNSNREVSLCLERSTEILQSYNRRGSDASRQKVHFTNRSSSG